MKTENLRREIIKAKTALILKARRQGLYENFGQKDVYALSEKFSPNPFGSSDERERARLIDEFEEWAYSYYGV